MRAVRFGPPLLFAALGAALSDFSIHVMQVACVELIVNCITRKSTEIRCGTNHDVRRIVSVVRGYLWHGRV